ncbi:MAG: THUMP domain-containing protein, partial [Bacteroidota bacterium]
MADSKFRMFAKTFAGLEEVLAEELRALGAIGIDVVPRGVGFTGGVR